MHLPSCQISLDMRNNWGHTKRATLMSIQRVGESWRWRGQRNSAQSAQSADDEASFTGPDGLGQHLGRRPAGARNCWCRASLDVSGCCLGSFSTSPRRALGPLWPEDQAKGAPGLLCRSATSLFRLGPHFAVLGVPQTMGLCRVCWSACRSFRQFQGNCLQVWRHSSDAGSRTVGAIEVPQHWKIELHPRRIRCRRMHAVTRHSLLGQSDAPKFSPEYPFLVPNPTHRPVDQWSKPARSVCSEAHPPGDAAKRFHSHLPTCVRSPPSGQLAAMNHYPAQAEWVPAGG